ncbi:MAG: hypothetical protein ACYC8T_24195 [Myxococcaceae bacterium]
MLPDVLRRRPWVLTALAALGIALPVFLSFNFVYRFAVDVPFWDQWELVPLLQRMADGTLSFADLFAQHNEHRILFPRIVTLLLARLSHWDVRLEMYTGWLMLLGVGTLLLVEHLRTFGRSSGAVALFIPIAWLAFSLRQENNLLWGWQLGIMLCSLSFLASMWCLSASDRHTGRVVLAVVSAVVCSFSFSAGLAVWGAGLVLLLFRLVLISDPSLRRRRLLVVALWAAAAALVLAVYLQGYVKPAHHPSTSDFLAHPGRALYFLLVALGGTVATEVNVPGAAAVGLGLVLLLGVLVFAVARGWVDAEKASFAAPLVAFAWATAGMLTVGRSGFDVGLGAASRYTTLTLLGIIGVYRGFLALRPGRLRRSALAAIVAMVLVGSFTSLNTAFSLGATVRGQRKQMQAALLDWRNHSDADLEALYVSAPLVRERAAILERLRLSVFRGP